MKKQSQSLFDKQLVQTAFIQAFVKLNPKTMFRNPVMFLVEIGTVVMLIVTIWVAMGEKSQGSLFYNLSVFFILLLTVLFANFAEAIAELVARHRLSRYAKRAKKHQPSLQMVLPYHRPS